MIGVSGCLAGLKCRYDGTSKPNAEIVRMVEEGRAVAFCPECLAGLPIPRTPSEISGGDGFDVLNGKAKVMSADGQDRTQDFIDAAEKALDFCRRKSIREAYLKSKSPSCGLHKIYDGSFNGALREGSGVTAAYLQQNGIKITEID